MPTDLNQPTPEFTPLIPPDALVVDHGSRDGKTCHLCQHPITEHGQMNSGCGVARCPCGETFGRP